MEDLQDKNHYRFSSSLVVLFLMIVFGTGWFMVEKLHPVETYDQLDENTIDQLYRDNRTIANH